MFGYFRFNQLYASTKIKNVYKNYYCGTCFALEYNYGEAIRCILSYDVVIFALIARLYEQPNKEILPCFFKKSEKEQFINNDEWKKVATINVLLVNAKLDDDINDEMSKKALIASKAFKSTIKKAEKNYPDLAEIVKNGYLKMYELEKQNASILSICDAFADMMAKLTASFGVDVNKIDFIKAISRWLYFIDQLDDYDEDIKENKYNPLVIKGVSKSEFINVKNGYLFEIMREIFKDYSIIKSKLNLSYSEDRLLYSLINESIPSVTSLVLSSTKLPQIIHTKKELEWRE